MYKMRKIEQELIDFANKHPKVKSVWKGEGVEGEKDRDYFYFLTEEFFDWDFSDELGDLTSRLLEMGHKKFVVTHWQYSENPRNDTHIKEPVYEKAA